MKTLKKLIEGYREFRDEYLSPGNASARERIATAQSPKVMVIACSDSRVNPAILTRAGLGDIFTVNNVANIVPPYKEGMGTHHSTSAAIEFAVLHLGVQHIIILGHSGCGGISALMAGNTRKREGEYSFIEPWMEIVAKAKTRTLELLPHASAQEQATCCEKEALTVSLANLETFPWVKESIVAGRLQIHAWYFDIGSGDILVHEPDEEGFHLLQQLEDGAFS